MREALPVATADDPALRRIASKARAEGRMLMILYGPQLEGVASIMLAPEGTRCCAGTYSVLDARKHRAFAQAIGTAPVAELVGPLH